MKKPYPLILAIFLAACIPGIQPASPTITLSPVTTRTATIPVTQTITPVPSTPDIDATATRFQIRVDGVCPTVIPSSSGSFSGFLSDAQILAEFTGVYRYGTGHSIHDLVIDCDHMYHEREWLDFGARRFGSGMVSIQGGFLVLDRIDQYGRLETHMHMPVRWGPRHYLVTYLKGVEGFCKAWAERDRSLEGGVGFFYLRMGDEKLEPTGDPILTSGEKVCP
jgi:hypothetical protein